MEDLFSLVFGRKRQRLLSSNSCSSTQTSECSPSSHDKNRPEEHYYLLPCEPSASAYSAHGKQTPWRVFFHDLTKPNLACIMVLLNSENIPLNTANTESSWCLSSWKLQCLNVPVWMKRDFEGKIYVLGVASQMS
jgi:hypothetical protein